jgi:uridylate kinase
MKHQFKDIVVIKLGGSIIYYSDKIDFNYLKRFKSFLEKELIKNKRRKFIIVVGGGFLARFLQDIAQKINKNTTDKVKDELGIYATKINAEIIKNLFDRKVVNPKIIDNKQKLINLNYKITILSGWTPSNSTDYIAAQATHLLNLKEYIIATKTDFVYNKNPEKYKNAVPLQQISWKKYLTEIVPPVWKPGSKFPIDVEAAKFSQKNKLKAFVINGKNLKNFSNLLNDKNFKGTFVY